MDGFYLHEIHDFDQMMAELPFHEIFRSDFSPQAVIVATMVLDQVDSGRIHDTTSCR
jgi:hypothetical protein